MGDNRDPLKKIYNEELPFKIAKRGWFTGNCTLQEIKGCKGFVLEPHRSAEPTTSLAINFFSTELLQVNPDEGEGLAQFMGRYGLLDCPYREQSVPSFDYSADPVLLPAIKETNNIRKLLREEHNKIMMQTLQEENKDLLPATSDFFAPVPQHFVSYSEAIAVLRLFQNIVNGLFSRLDGMAWEDSYLLEFVNLNVGNYNRIENVEFEDMPIAVKEGDVLIEALHLGYLTCAISNQIVETIADEAAWYKCKAANCGRWFKRKRGTASPRMNSEYCSTTCSERMRKRRQRGTADPSAR